MRAGPEQAHFRVCDFVNQKPVWLDVAFPDAFPFSNQFVWTIAGRERSCFGEELDCGYYEVFNLIAASLYRLKGH